MKFHFFHLMPWPDLPDDFAASAHVPHVEQPDAWARAVTSFLGA